MSLDAAAVAGRASRADTPASIDAVAALLDRGGYIADRRLATVLFLSLRLRRPLFLEGEAGVGKTEIAKVLAAALGRRLIRLQCYEGLDLAAAVYEWNYPRQMLEIRLAEARGRAFEAGAAELYSERFLIRRPLLQALADDDGPAVLLIDEIDRADEPFEAFLLELLSDYQITIPEFGVVAAAGAPPIVILTSNRTREVHDALKRRCLYHWVDYPSEARERAILARKAPAAAGQLSRDIVGFVQRLRELRLFKPPGVAETLDWAQALIELDAVALDPALIADTLGAVLKYHDDIARLTGSEPQRILDEIRRAAQPERPPL